MPPFFVLGKYTRQIKSFRARHLRRYRPAHLHLRRRRAPGPADEHGRSGQHDQRLCLHGRSGCFPPRLGLVTQRLYVGLLVKRRWPIITIPEMRQKRPFWVRPDIVPSRGPSIAFWLRCQRPLRLNRITMNIIHFLHHNLVLKKRHGQWAFLKELIFRVSSVHFKTR